MIVKINHKIISKEVKERAVISALEAEGFIFEKIGPYHYRGNGVDFWPTTGRYFNHKTKRSGYRLTRMIRVMQKNQDSLEDNHQEII